MQFVLFLVPFTVLASRAPDIAPDLPDGWCRDLNYGTPTRSTGECICKYGCSGNGCRREHGLNWYEYRSCPTCKCVAGEKSYLPQNNQVLDDTAPPEISNEEEGMKDEESTLFDLIEENSRYVFAGVVTLVVFALAFVIIFGLGRTA
jgi:hypothetical protein